MRRRQYQRVQLLVGLQLQRVLLLSHIGSAAGFASCPPPRFDTFADSITGKWQYGPSLPDQAREVEEVMRSCGGAVQGITEMVLPTTTCRSNREEDVIKGRYHNRADDGFIYFDCGSYSAGPVQLVEGSVVEMMSSLAFPSIPKRRLLISAKCQVGGTSGGILSLKPIDNDDVMAIGLNRVPIRAAEEEEAAESDSSVLLGTKPGSTIHWHNESVCRMPNTSQPWILQRAKWECFLSEGKDIDINSEETGEKPSREHLVGWMMIQGSDDDTDTDRKLWKSSGLGFLDTSEDNGGVVVQIGALCRVTKQARAVIRSFDAQGKLNGVILQEGIAT